MMQDEGKPQAGDVWTSDEIYASVDAWVKMLEKQRTGTPFVKAEIIRQLRDGELSVRNKSSVEKRFQNITAVAIALDNDWVNGYPPLSNVGPTQWERIQDRLQFHRIGDVIEERVDEEFQILLDSTGNEDLNDFEKLRLRERAWRLVTQRSGQNTFRKVLLSAYSERCVVSRSNVIQGLEAAHISPYDGPASNVPTNGLLLRADIHRMFDAGLLGIEPDDYTAVLSPSLRNKSIARHEGQRIIFPEKEVMNPDRRLLEEHLELAMSYW